MDRAGFTDVFVTGMLTRWIKVDAETDGERRETFRGALVGRSHDHNQEDRSQHDLDDQTGKEVVLPGRVVAVAVRREPAGRQRILRRALWLMAISHKVAEAAMRREHLRDEVRDCVLPLEARAAARPEGDRWIEVSAGDVTSA